MLEQNYHYRTQKCAVYRPCATQYHHQESQARIGIVHVTRQDRARRECKQLATQGSQAASRDHNLILAPPRIITERLHAGFVLSEPLGQMAQGRPCESLRPGVAHHEHQARTVIGREITPPVYAKPNIGHSNSDQPFRAEILHDLPSDCHRCEQLAKSECYQKKLKAPRSQRYKAECRSSQSATSNSSRDDNPCCGYAALKHHKGHAVPTQPEIRRLAERRQTSVPVHQIDAYGQQAKAYDLFDKVEIEGRHHSREENQPGDE